MFHRTLFWLFSCLTSSTVRNLRRYFSVALPLMPSLAASVRIRCSRTRSALNSLLLTSKVYLCGHWIAAFKMALIDSSVVASSRKTDNMRLESMFTFRSQMQTLASASIIIAVVANAESLSLAFYPLMCCRSKCMPAISTVVAPLSSYSKVQFTN